VIAEIAPVRSRSPTSSESWPPMVADRSSSLPRSRMIEEAPFEPSPRRSYVAAAVEEAGRRAPPGARISPQNQEESPSARSAPPKDSAARENATGGNAVVRLENPEPRARPHPDGSDRLSGRDGQERSSSSTVNQVAPEVQEGRAPLCQVPRPLLNGNSAHVGDTAPHRQTPRRPCRNGSAGRRKPRSSRSEVIPSGEPPQVGRQHPAPARSSASLMGGSHLFSMPRRATSSVATVKAATPQAQSIRARCLKPDRRRRIPTSPNGHAESLLPERRPSIIDTKLHPTR